MQLISPFALFALTTLLIPLLIHLWNVKTGKTLKIGSVLLLGTQSPSSAKRFRMRDWLLYLLRSLLLLLLVFILAEPVFETVVGKGAPKGWLLMERNQVELLREREYKSIDSLNALGYEVHLLEVGFPLFDMKNETRDEQDSVPSPLSYSSLLKQLSTVLPNEFPVVIFTDSRILHFGDEQPNMGMNVRWVEVKTADSLRGWLAQGINQVYEAKSSPSATYYEPVGNPKDLVLKVLIHEDFPNKDAKYLRSALSAIAEFMQIELVLSHWASQGIVSKGAEMDLAFWLSDQEVDADFLTKVKAGGRLFSYEKGKELVRNSFLRSVGSGFGNEKFIEVYKRILPQVYKGEPLWVDSYGDPLLSVEQQERYERFYFYCKLNPQWTDLVWSDQFLSVLLPVLMGNAENRNDFGYEDHVLDRRVWTNVSETARPPKREAIVKKPVMEGRAQRDSAIVPLWIIAFLIFMLERVLTFRKKKEVKLG